MSVHAETSGNNALAQSKCIEDVRRRNKHLLEFKETVSRRSVVFLGIFISRRKLVHLRIIGTVVAKEESEQEG